MKITRFTEEQIIAAIRSQVSGEKTVERVSRELGISETKETTEIFRTILVPETLLVSWNRLV